MLKIVAVFANANLEGFFLQRMTMALSDYGPHQRRLMGGAHRGAVNLRFVHGIYVFRTLS